jgi:pimeloyl-ACP methyl ester carboxylesterase
MSHNGARGRRPRRFLTAGLVFVSVITLTACAALFPRPSNDDSNRSDSSGITIASLRPAQTSALRSYYAQKLIWTPCHQTLQCSIVRVPVDWQKVTSTSISLALVKHSARGTSVGDLVVNPGGPGGSGVGFVEGGIGDVVDSTIAKNYDIIGFDPRGVGESAPVTCFDNTDTDRYFYGIDPGAIGSAQWIAAERAKAVALAKACEKGTGPVLGHIDSISAATDMDVIRAALGQSKLNFLGYSYGTYLGTLYAGLYPDRVGKMVLDGADDPWGTNYTAGDGSDSSSDFGVDPGSDGIVEQAVGFEDALSSYLQSCLTNVSATVGDLRCPFLSSLSNAKKSVEGFLSAAAAHPLVGSDGRLMGSMTLATAIDDALYDPTDWPDLTRMFVQVKDRNPKVAFEFADDYNDRNSDGTYDDNGDLAHLAIGCLEEGPSVDLKFDNREATELRKVAPVLGIYSAYSDLACSGWKYGPAPFPDPVHAPGTGGILVLGTTGDPATPYAEAQELAKQLDAGVLVTYHGQGHTAYDRGDDCIDSTVDAYLLNYTVPSKDPSCR